ncbi:right-handed parallel beta-helix repeat-containing protein [Phenylobacterium koreense]|uniref:Right handed beta helix domain-containing protein n=1 Tax=Phenylobacterium koreense TaxID=266125 RepID=A0ABV2ENF5_9CAUL
MDYLHGSDAAAGTSPALAWKRAPGDPLAADNSKSVKLEPGDTVRFRGGVAYRGAIRLPASGTAEQPITYAGDQWGPEPAIFNGSDPVISVQRCSSSEACGGAVNWKQLSLVIFVPTPVDAVKFFDGSGQLYESQYPNPKEPFLSDDIQEYKILPLQEADAAERGEVRSKALAKLLPEGAGDAELSFWIAGNNVARRKIIEVDGDRLRFDPAKLSLYKNRDGRLALMNAPSLVDRPGTYATLGAGRAIVWPRTPNGEGLVVGSGRTGFDLRGRSDVVIRGFVFENFVGGKRGGGFQIANLGGISSRAKIVNNVFRRSTLYSGAGVIVPSRLDGALISGNTITDIERGSGIRTGLRPISNVEIVGNRFERLGRTGILLMGASNVTIANNTMNDIRGIHGNGISIYADNRRVTVEGNRITNAVRPLTFQGEPSRVEGDHRIRIRGNFFQTIEPTAGAIISYGRNTRDVVIENNTLIGPSIGLLLHAGDANVVVRGNRTSGIKVKGERPDAWVVTGNSGVPGAFLKPAH